MNKTHKHPHYPSQLGSLVKKAAYDIKFERLWYNVRGGASSEQFARSGRDFDVIFPTKGIPNYSYAIFL